MSYCTEDEIKDFLGEAEFQKLVRERLDDTDNADQVTMAIADADAEIDSYLGGVYIVPFSPVPTLIRNTSVNISVFYLAGGRPGLEEDRIKAYERMIERLKRLQDGGQVLDGANRTTVNNIRSTPRKPKRINKTFLAGY